MNRESSYQVADVVHIFSTGGQIMKSSKSSVRIWRITGISSIVATIVLIGGFIYAISDVLHPEGSAYTGTASTEPATNETAATTANADGSFRVTVLGDSLAKGTGDDDGSGFARRTVDLLQKDGKDAKLIANLGINGQKTASVLSSLEETGVQHTLQQSNMIFVSIGANDLFNAGEALGNNQQQAPTKQQLLANLPKASKTLQQILERIAKINPDAHILYLGLYNPFSDLPELRVPGNEAVTTWNTTAMNIINSQSNMSLIPTFDLFQKNINKYLSSDHFHPNGAGYEQIAERVVQSIE